MSRSGEWPKPVPAEDQIDRREPVLLIHRREERLPVAAIEPLFLAMSEARYPRRRSTMP